MNITVNASLTLKKGEGRSLKAGGAWIYDNEIAQVTGAPKAGALVEVHDFDGYYLGQGFYNPHSKLTVRMLTRRREHPVTEELLKGRVRDAYAYRQCVTDSFDPAQRAHAACRLIFGEADFLPGLTVDRFADLLVVESLALGIDRLKPLLLRELVDALEENGIRIRGIYERSDSKTRELEGMERYSGFLGIPPKKDGSENLLDGRPFDTTVEILENGLYLTVDVANGQKTGYFLDQQENRAAVGALVRRMTANGLGRMQEGSTAPRVLDCFTCTGSFALNAAKAGAASVLGVDASELAVEQARANAERNGLSDRASFLAADVFEFLPAEEAKGSLYDVVILDPPAFTKSRSSVKNAEKGYREINLRGMKLVKDGGYLVTCSCSQHVLPPMFQQMLLDAQKDARVQLRQGEFRTQGRDHPILTASPETQYLKCGIYQVYK